MKLATMMKLAASSVLAASLIVVGVGCDDQTGSTINGGDPGPDRVNPEPPYSEDATEPGVMGDPGADTGTQP